jgi:hypothetical protein
MQQQGWWQCPTAGCGFWLNPQAKSRIEGTSGYFTCPKCYHSYNLLEHLPWHGPEDSEEFFGSDRMHGKAGGGTKIGIPLTDQGQIGENLIANMGTIPGYGPITWWHPGGAGSTSPLDGATAEWGIEVKTLGMDAMHHRFAPGGESGPKTIQDKNEMAQEMGLKGILGLLVMLDYKRDLADVYLKEMPLAPWRSVQGVPRGGVGQFRKNTAVKIASGLPFDNPYKDPANPTPTSHRAADYYQSPGASMPSHLREPEPTPAPF